MALLDLITFRATPTFYLQRHGERSLLQRVDRVLQEREDSLHDQDATTHDLQQC